MNSYFLRACSSMVSATAERPWRIPEFVSSGDEILEYRLNPICVFSSYW